MPKGENPITYRYTKDGQPLTHCPLCGNDLTEPDGVSIILSIGGTTTQAATCLEDGVLIDTPDHAVAKGFHSLTQCAGCDESLIDFGVHEEQT